jgi:hypothetical protein
MEGWLAFSWQVVVVIVLAFSLHLRVAAPMPTTAQLCQGVLRMRVHAFGLLNVGSRYSMKSKLTVPNVV